MKVLDESKFSEDERFSNTLMKGMSTAECPIDRECFRVFRVGASKLRNVCPHFRADDDHAYCLHGEFTQEK